MEGLRKVQHAEYLLEAGMLQAFGWERDSVEPSRGIWFQDWWFDTYDSSVELAEAEPGRIPSPDELAALHGLGIACVYVSYTDGLGHLWYFQGGEWRDGKCGPRASGENKSLLFREAKRRAYAAGYAAASQDLSKPKSGTVAAAEYSDEGSTEQAKR